MNYNSLIFRQDKTGIDEYVKWTGITSDLMEAYLYSQRVMSSGVSCILFEDQLIPEQKVLSSFNQFFYIYQKYLERGYNIERIADLSGIYSLGAFEDDYRNCELVASDFSSYVTNQPKEKFLVSNGMIQVEMFDRGSIIKELKNDVTYYYSNDNVNFLKRLKEFPMDIETVASINVGMLKRKDNLDIIDGLENNRMSDNFRKVLTYQKMLNRFRVGYSVLQDRYASGRCKFLPQLWYKGKNYTGRQCDNEVEAICEAYILENQIAYDDKEFLYSPVTNHKNQAHLVERYIRGEITDLGFERDMLIEIANNPFLVLRYNLIDLCRKYCIYIPPFKLDEEGYMINFNGVRYSELASKYANGVLSRHEIYTQSYLEV